MRDSWPAPCWSLECRSISASSDISPQNCRERLSNVLVPWDCSYLLAILLREQSGFPGRSLKLMRQKTMATFFVSLEPTAAPYMFQENPKTTVSILRMFHCLRKNGKRIIRDK